VKDRFNSAATFADYLGRVRDNADLWRGVYKRARVPGDLAEAVRGVPGVWRLLALSEDWCGDACNILPVVARFAETAPRAELRVLSRDANLDLMDAHLTNGRNRSIPVVILLDERFEEAAWWGPRPAALQKWVTEEGRKLDPEVLYGKTRAFYAKDKGRSIVREILGMMQEAAARGLRSGRGGPAGRCSQPFSPTTTMPAPTSPKVLRRFRAPAPPALALAALALGPLASPSAGVAPSALAAAGSPAVLRVLALAAQTRDYRPERPFGTLREQARTRQAWLEERLDRNLPMLMRKHGVEMWVVAMREYNEDPVFRALVSPTTFAARRRTIYVFHDRGPDEGVERLALGGTSQGGVYEAVRATAEAPDGRAAELWGRDQWDLFARMVRERDPSTIAVNVSHDHNFADGLAAGEWEQMRLALGPELADRVVRRPLLAVEYLAMRVPSMAPAYRRAQVVVHDIIGTAFSDVVIEPGRTTTADVVWWMRQRVRDLGLESWFQPSVSVQRRGVSMADSVAPAIRRGDVLHCDFGLVALGLATDTQHMAYVLREGETDAPEGLRRALANSNRLQDILMEEIVVGRTGNEILAVVLERMRGEGLDGTMYTHPIGDHGHGAGPLIGLWDYQTGVPGRGDPPVIAGMWFSTELQVSTPVPEWDGQRVRMAQEEEAEVTESGEVRWMLRRQTELHLIR